MEAGGGLEGKKMMKADYRPDQGILEAARPIGHAQPGVDDDGPRRQTVAVWGENGASHDDSQIEKSCVEERNWSSTWIDGQNPELNPSLATANWNCW